MQSATPSRGSALSREVTPALTDARRYGRGGLSDERFGCRIRSMTSASVGAMARCEVLISSASPHPAVVCCLQVDNCKRHLSREKVSALPATGCAHSACESSSRGQTCLFAGSCSRDAGLAVPQTYFRRYRCCMSHSKAPSVLVDGQVVRWCQQCCCFHELSAFDDDKRCCLLPSVRMALVYSACLKRGSDPASPICWSCFSRACRSAVQRMIITTTSG